MPGCGRLDVGVGEPAKERGVDELSCYGACHQACVRLPAPDAEKPVIVRYGAESRVAGGGCLALLIRCCWPEVSRGKDFQQSDRLGRQELVDRIEFARRYVVANPTGDDDSMEIDLQTPA